MSNNLTIDINNEASFVLDQNNMPNKIIMQKNTSVRTAIDGFKYTIDKKSDVIVAAITLKDGNTVSHAVVYEPVFTKEIKSAFDKIVELNNLEVAYNVKLAPSYNTQPRSALGNGGYKAAKISDYKQR